MTGTRVIDTKMFYCLLSIFKQNNRINLKKAVNNKACRLIKEFYRGCIFTLDILVWTNGVQQLTYY
jgi:hypothetical protein